MLNTIFNKNQITAKRAKQVFMSLVFLLVLIGMYLDPLWGFAVIFYILLGIGLGTIFDGVWCNWLCPRGSYFETCLRHISLKRPAPGFVKTTWFKVLVMVIFTVIFINGTVHSWGSLENLGRFYVMVITVSTILGIVLGLYFIPRIWCIFCPVGCGTKWLRTTIKRGAVHEKDSK